MINQNIQKRNQIITSLGKYGFVIIILIYCLIFFLTVPRFLTLQNIMNIMVQMVPIGVMAIGVSFVLITGGIDLTAGVGVSMCAVTIELAIRNFNNPFLAIFLGLLTVLILGSINGFFISVVGIEPIMLTLVNMTTVLGVIQIITRSSTPLNLMNPFFAFINNTVFLKVIPFPFILLVIVAIMANILLKHTRFGLRTTVIGNNREGAEHAGINVKYHIFMVYVICALGMWVASVVLVAKLAYVMPSLGGTPLFLDALAAALIGGVAVNGGKGNISGILLGALSITLINNSVNLLDIHPNWNNFFKGAVIVLMLGINRIIESFEEKI